MNIFRCWSRSVGFFFNPRLLFKELSDYFSVAYRSMLFYVATVNILTAGFVLLGVIIVLSRLPIGVDLFPYLTILFQCFSVIFIYFFVIFGRKIKSPSDIFKYAHKSLPMLFYLLVIMWLAGYCYGLFSSVFTQWVTDIIQWFTSHGYNVADPSEAAILVMNYLMLLVCESFAPYVFFVFDGVGYYKSVGRTLYFFICNLPFLVIWTMLVYWLTFFLLKPNIKKLNLESSFGEFFVYILIASLVYAGAYFLLSISYFYYERMKKYVR